MIIETPKSQDPPSESIRRHRKRRASVPWEDHVVPRKQGRGRPMLIRTGSSGRPRKVYSSASDRERDPNDEEEREDSDDTEHEEENERMEDNVFEEAHITVTENPTTWSQAIKTREANSWKLALEDEMLAQIKNQTWEVTEKPIHRKVIGSRYVFCTKYDGKNEKKKVRLVAKGCAQRPGEDFTETFSPVVRSTSVRILAAVAAEYDLQIHQMDIVTAYLNGELREKVYMEVPECLREIVDKINAGEPVGSDGKAIGDVNIVNTAKRWREGMKNDEHVCVLVKALYGLRQSGVEWYNKLIEKLLKLGFKPLLQDKCMLVARKNDKVMYITIYVDDILIAGNDEEWIKFIKKELSKSFQTKDLGLVSKCLGIEFERDAESRVSMRQRQYTEALINKFRMDECKPVDTPIRVKCDLVKPENASMSEMKKYPYQSLIGGLLYLSVTTTPDIACAVTFLSQFNTAYDESHWKAAKRVLRYLKGTIYYGLMYERTDLALFGLVDASYGGKAAGQKSYTGYSFILAGAAISWDPREQKTVTLSSTEAEYMAMAEATKEALYLRGMLDCMGVQDKNEKIVLFNDNQSAIKMIVNNVYHARTKHIDVRHYFVRDEYEKGVIDVIHMRTEKMPADVLTKGLSAIKHWECIDNIGVVEI